MPTGGVDPEVVARIEELVAEKQQEAERIAELPTPARARQIRERSGTSIREMAATLGVTPRTVVQWEHGRSTPRPEHAERYRVLLDALEGLGPAPRRRKRT